MVKFISLGKRVLVDRDELIAMIKGDKSQIEVMEFQMVDGNVTPVAPTKKNIGKPSKEFMTWGQYNNKQIVHARDIAPEGVTHETHITLDEACAKYGIKYGAFYTLRKKYGVTSIRAWGTTAFERQELDAAFMKSDADKGRNLGEHWYSTLDIKELYGLGPTQIRRFAKDNNVRTKTVQAGHMIYYLKADWEDARRKSEKRSWNTKGKRNTDNPV